MSYSKAHLFPPTDQQTAHLAKAIAHPARIAILKIMAQYDFVEGSFLRSRIPLSAPTIQQHLDYLHARDIVGIDPRPVKARYHVNWDSFEGFRTILTNSLYVVGESRTRAPII